MDTGRLIERCITTLKADIRVLQQQPHAGSTEGYPMPPDFTEALLRRKRLMLASLRRERRRSSKNG